MTSVSPKYRQTCRYRPSPVTILTFLQVNIVLLWTLNTIEDAVTQQSTFIPSAAAFTNAPFPFSAKLRGHSSHGHCPPARGSSAVQQWTRLALSAYEPIYEDKPTKQTKKPLYPKPGDIVRYYDIDGGKADGQVLVGKIAYIQKVLGPQQGESNFSWAVELTQLQDVGEGFYAEYSSRQRNFKKSMRPLDQVAPIAASWVRTESAYKIPRTHGGLPAVRAEQYDIETYPGPFVGENSINPEVLLADSQIYSSLKGKLLRETVLLGIAGTILADLLKGPEDAAIYATGALAGLAYLFLLSVKTDTLGSSQAKLGSTFSNLRFAMPLLVFLIVAGYNKVVLGTNSPVSASQSIFTSVSPEQFAAGVIGFLTYRVPLFANQISDLFKDAQAILPGSVGMAINLAKQQEAEEKKLTSAMGDLPTILVVSGPQAAGRTELVQRLIAESDGQFIPPPNLDRIEEGAKFELLESRDELLSIDSSGRFGITKEGILKPTATPESVVVMDATVDMVKKLCKIPGIRIIGVWVGLDSTEKFERNLRSQLSKGELRLPEGEDEPSFLRAKIKEIVKDIEYGIVSGVFEFTILNDDIELSMQQLREAAQYCFK